MRAIDTDIISLDIPRSLEDAKRSMAFKDAMREACIETIALAWFEMIRTYHRTRPDVAAAVLGTVRCYVNWIDICLVANDQFIPLVLQLISGTYTPSTSMEPSAVAGDHGIPHPYRESCRVAAAEVLSEVVGKRMEASAKVALIHQLGVVPMCARWIHDGLPVDPDDEDLPGALGSLLASVATELDDSLKKIENSVVGIAAVGLDMDPETMREATRERALAERLLNDVVPVIFTALTSPALDVCAPAVTFLTTYVNRLKRLAQSGTKSSGGDATSSSPASPGNSVGLSGDQRGHCRSALRAIATRLAADAKRGRESDVDGDDVISDEGDDQQSAPDATVDRTELLTLFKNIAHVTWSEAVMLQSELIQDVLRVEPTPAAYQVEVTARLLYALGEGAPESSFLADGDLGRFVVALMAGSVPFLATDATVAIALLECFMRFAKVLEDPSTAELIPTVLCMFMDHGVLRVEPTASARACYLFMRLCKALRSHLRVYLNDILARIHTHMDRTLSRPPLLDMMSGGGRCGDGPPTSAAATPSASGGAAPSKVDPRLYVFEAMSYLLGTEEMVEDVQLHIVSAVVDKICQQITSLVGQIPHQNQTPTLTALASAGIAQAMLAAGAFARGFTVHLTNVSRPALGLALLRVVEVTLEVPRAVPSHQELTQRTVGLIHRMVDVLGERVLPGATRLLEILLTNPVPDVAGLKLSIGLMVQLMMKFKITVMPLMREALPLLRARTDALLGPTFLWNGPSKSANTTATPTTTTLDASSPLTPATTSAAISEELREQAEVQRAFFAVLHCIAKEDLGMIVLSIADEERSKCIQALEFGAARHVDPLIRRVCIQTLGTLAASWCPVDAPEVVPHMRDWTLEHLVASCCLRGLLSADASLDVRDAGVWQLTSEVASQLRALRAHLGEAMHVRVAETLQELSLPKKSTTELVNALKSADVTSREVRSMLRQLMMLQQGRSAPAGV
jgi:exportin-T